MFQDIWFFKLGANFAIVGCSASRKNDNIMFKDTHREKAPSNKTLGTVGTLYQLFIRGS